MIWTYHIKQFLSFVLKERFHPRAYARGPQLKFDSVLFRGFCERGIGQRWTEGEMQKCEVIFSRALRRFRENCIQFVLPTVPLDQSFQTQRRLEIAYILNF